MGGPREMQNGGSQGFQLRGPSQRTGEGGKGHEYAKQDGQKKMQGEEQTTKNQLQKKETRCTSIYAYIDMYTYAYIHVFYIYIYIYIL
jgi:hypothetical protein